MRLEEGEGLGAGQDAGLTFRYDQRLVTGPADRAAKILDHVEREQLPARRAAARAEMPEVEDQHGEARGTEALGDFGQPLFLHPAEAMRHDDQRNGGVGGRPVEPAGAAFAA